MLRVNRKETRVTAMPTIKNGVMDSPRRIPMNCLPYFFITSIFNSAPTRKPIRARAMLFTGSRAAIVSGLRI